MMEKNTVIIMTLTDIQTRNVVSKSNAFVILTLCILSFADLPPVLATIPNCISTLSIFFILLALDDVATATLVNNADETTTVLNIFFDF